jgi:hypothetical protein
LCNSMLATFSGKMPACNVQTSASSDAATSRSISARPTPRPRAASLT